MCEERHAWCAGSWRPERELTNDCHVWHVFFFSGGRPRFSLTAGMLNRLRALLAIPAIADRLSLLLLPPPPWRSRCAVSPQAPPRGACRRLGPFCVRIRFAALRTLRGLLIVLALCFPRCNSLPGNLRALFRREFFHAGCSTQSASAGPARKATRSSGTSTGWTAIRPRWPPGSHPPPSSRRFRLSGSSPSRPCPRRPRWTAWCSLTGPERVL